MLLYSRLLADLNSPVFVPDTVRLDRKHILEDIESKYREFITGTLRCLSELKRELCEWQMDDTNHPMFLEIRDILYMYIFYLLYFLSLSYSNQSLESGHEHGSPSAEHL